MKSLNEKKAGFVLLIGRPNVGKSTLLNNILGQKVSIVSNVPQTTRFSIRGILNEKRGQIVFIDTPGIYITKKMISKALSSRGISMQEDVDVILYLVDLTRRPGKEEAEVMKSLKETKTPIIMALNKRDLGQYYADDYIENWRDKTNPIRKQKTASNGASNTESLKYFIPISALEKRNLDRLLDALFEFLPESDNLYPLDIVSDLPQKLLIADIIREKIFNQTQDEVPHSVAVKIDNIEEKENGVLYIQATILVERSSQKAIIIGAKGKFLKAIGTEARKELQSNYNRKVYLDLWVKIQKNWQNNPAVLKDLGYIV